MGLVQEKCTDAAWKTLRAAIWRLGNHRGVSDQTSSRRSPLERDALMSDVACENGGRLLDVQWSTLAARVECRFDVYGAQVFELKAHPRNSQRRRDDQMLESFVLQVRSLDLMVA
jgi:hypothetical protein